MKERFDKAEVVKGFWFSSERAAPHTYLHVVRSELGLQSTARALQRGMDKSYGGYYPPPRIE